MPHQTQRLVVIKFGGNALTETSGKAFCHCVAQLPKMGYCPIIVHGGGPQINDLLAALNIESHFVNGLRYTDAETLKVAEMVLSGSVNKMFVQFLGNEQVNAVGISGKDGKLLTAAKLAQDNQGKPIDLGYVGEIKQVNPQLLQVLTQQQFIPVIAPLAYGDDGHTYNINADYAAAAIAKEVNATHFIAMTNIEGLLDAEKKIIHQANTNDIHQLIEKQVIQGGMIPKTLSAVDTLSNVGEVNLIDGRHPEHLLAVLSGKTIGTRITR